LAAASWEDSCCQDSLQPAGARAGSLQFLRGYFRACARRHFGHLKARTCSSSNQARAEPCRHSKLPCRQPGCLPLQADKAQGQAVLSTCKMRWCTAPAVPYLPPARLLCPTPPSRQQCTATEQECMATRLACCCCIPDSAAGALQWSLAGRTPFPLPHPL
jgi:hypothetical protein